MHELLTTANFSHNRFLHYICHGYYRNISKIVEKTAEDFNLTYNVKPTFGRALLSHIAMLKKLGRMSVDAIPSSAN